MAGGNLSPRQKMINMMYLVLTALLALNVSREVIDSIYEAQKGQEASIETIEKQNARTYLSFEAAAAENEVKAGPWRDKANEVMVRSSALYNKIGDLKKGVIDVAGGPEEDDPNKPRRMDNLTASPQYFLQQPNGAELKSLLVEYREFMKSNSVDNVTLSNSIDDRFDLSEKNIDGTVMKWENIKFEHYPLISVTNYLTKLQTDVRTTEADVIDYLQRNINAKDIKVTGVKSVVIPRVPT